jgi:hypothetical protein
MNDNTSQEPTLVLGGTGKIARRVVEEGFAVLEPRNQDEICGYPS